MPVKIKQQDILSNKYYAERKLERKIAVTD